MTSRQAKDVEEFLKTVTQRLGEVDDGTHHMFRLLVETTLKYRDEIFESEKHTLSVGETQEALDAFMEVMKTHQIPPKLSKHVHGLVIAWLQEIKHTVHH